MARHRARRSTGRRLITAVVLIAASVALVLEVLLPVGLRAWLERALAGSTTPIAVDSVAVHVLEPGIGLRGLVVGDPSAPAIVAARVRIPLEPRALLERRLVIPSLTVTDAELDPVAMSALDRAPLARLLGGVGVRDVDLRQVEGVRVDVAPFPGVLPAPARVRAAALSPALGLGAVRFRLDVDLDGGTLEVEGEGRRDDDGYAVEGRVRAGEAGLGALAALLGVGDAVSAGTLAGNAAMTLRLRPGAAGGEVTLRGRLAVRAMSARVGAVSLLDAGLDYDGEIHREWVSTGATGPEVLRVTGRATSPTLGIAAAGDVAGARLDADGLEWRGMLELHDDGTTATGELLVPQTRLVLGDRLELVLDGLRARPGVEPGGELRLDEVAATHARLDGRSPQGEGIAVELDTPRAATVVLAPDVARVSALRAPVARLHAGGGTPWELLELVVDQLDHTSAETRLGVAAAEMAQRVDGGHALRLESPRLEALVGRDRALRATGLALASVFDRIEPDRTVIAREIALDTLTWTGDGLEAAAARVREVLASTATASAVELGGVEVASPRRAPSGALEAAELVVTRAAGRVGDGRIFSAGRTRLVAPRLDPAGAVSAERIEVAQVAETHAGGGRWALHELVAEAPSLVDGSGLGAASARASTIEGRLPSGATFGAETLRVTAPTVADGAVEAESADAATVQLVSGGRWDARTIAVVAPRLVAGGWSAARLAVDAVDGELSDGRVARAATTTMERLGGGSLDTLRADGAQAQRVAIERAGSLIASAEGVRAQRLDLGVGAGVGAARLDADAVVGADDAWRLDGVSGLGAHWLPGARGEVDRLDAREAVSRQPRGPWSVRALRLLGLAVDGGDSLRIARAEARSLRGEGEQRLTAAALGVSGLVVGAVTEAERVSLVHLEHGDPADPATASLQLERLTVAGVREALGGLTLGAARARGLRAVAGVDAEGGWLLPVPVSLVAALGERALRVDDLRLERPGELWLFDDRVAPPVDLRLTDLDATVRWQRAGDAGSGAVSVRGRLPGGGGAGLDVTVVEEGAGTAVDLGLALGGLDATRLAPYLAGVAPTGGLIDVGLAMRRGLDGLRAEVTVLGDGVAWSEPTATVDTAATGSIAAPTLGDAARRAAALRASARLRRRDASGLPDLKALAAGLASRMSIDVADPAAADAASPETVVGFVAATDGFTTAGLRAVDALARRLAAERTAVVELCAEVGAAELTHLRRDRVAAARAALAERRVRAVERALGGDVAAARIQRCVEGEDVASEPSTPATDPSRSAPTSAEPLSGVEAAASGVRARWVAPAASARRGGPTPGASWIAVAPRERRAAR
ncbi:MAG: DUF748 domain-containing protein [Ectothiorhodospiraceae bacterium]|nr:DUF748 domain-containing protein [Ectothiorhodospiraceae bacterium]